MNENVTNKTPKRRRWIARLLVSALCILLASSLLFVTVVAENVNTYTFNVIDQSTSDSHSFYGYFYGSDGFYGLSELAMTPSGFYFYGTSYLYENSYSSPLFQLEYSGSFGTDFAILFVGSSPFGYWVLYSYGSTYYAECFNWSGSRTVFISTEGATYSTSQNSNKYFCYFSIDGYAFSGGINDGTFVYSNGVKTSVEGYYNCLIYGGGSYFALSSYSLDYAFNLTDYSFSSNTQSFGIFPSYYLRSFGDIFCAYYPGYVGFGKFNRIFAIDDGVLSYSTASGSFASDLSYNLCFLGNVSGNGYSDTEIGRGWSNVRTGDALSSYKIGSIYATSSEYVPPESSDETTEEPPPESSEESSEEPVGGGTNIWGSILNADGSYTSTLLGTLDLSQSTEVRAYIGSWTSKDSSYQSETPVPLTFYVYNGEEGPPDIYTFDYHAAGYSLSGDSASDFTFPDLIGQFFTLPFNGETDLYFANVAPYGTVLVSTPFGDSFGGRVMLNLVSADSYFRLDFVDEDTFTVVVYNEDPVGSRVSFEMDIRAYREGYRLEDGETSSSRWFYPSFGSSASYTAEYVTENGLYLVFVDSVNDTVYPWEDGTWSDIIGDANSRLEDISIDHALLESMANDAYGQYSFDPMTNRNFAGAVSEFNDIRNSSGGEYILRYMWGMWNVHPFASSMIAIVGTLAIVGFIIRKM